MLKAIELISCKFLVNPSTFASAYAHVAHYVFDKTSVSNKAFAVSQQYDTAWPKLYVRGNQV